MASRTSAVPSSTSLSEVWCGSPSDAPTCGRPQVEIHQERGARGVVGDAERQVDGDHGLARLHRGRRDGECPPPVLLHLLQDLGAQQVELAPERIGRVHGDDALPLEVCWIQRKQIHGHTEIRVFGDEAKGKYARRPLPQRAAAGRPWSPLAGVPVQWQV
jgi:hypothetical protein